MSDQKEQPRDNVTGTPTEQPRPQVVFTRTEPSRDAVVLAVNGPLTDDVVDTFQQHLEELIAGRWPLVTLDFTRVTGISSRCIGKIMFLRMKLDEKKRSLRIGGCDPELYKSFKTMRLDFFMDISM
jgi:anti-anti-sigma regulatory factor